jgi:hypothetical protein
MVIGEYEEIFRAEKKIFDLTFAILSADYAFSKDSKAGQIQKT